MVNQDENIYSFRFVIFLGDFYIVNAISYYSFLYMLGWMVCLSFILCLCNKMTLVPISL